MTILLRLKFWRSLMCGLMVITFTATSIGPACGSTSLTTSAQTLMPAPGTMVALSPAFQPPMLKGVKVYANEPFKFDFILDEGNATQGHKSYDISHKKEENSGGFSYDIKRMTYDPASEARRLIRYFLASLTVPESDLWVNLSPYEKDRIITDEFGKTTMGRDLLAQDYLLKQITASILYPEGETGKKFWTKVYAEAQKRFGTIDIPVDTFNKVWIVPEKAVVYERSTSQQVNGSTGNENSAVAYVVESKLKVMLETDYLATQKDNRQQAADSGDPSCPAAGCQLPAVPQDFSKNILREIAIPILEQEVNEGENFAPLRQVYQSLILAAWYKRKIKDSLLAQTYADKKKMAGLEREKSQNVKRSEGQKKPERSDVLTFEPLQSQARNSSDFSDDSPEAIWSRYVDAFKKGAYNYIKEEQDTLTGEMIPRKYFSGGLNMDMSMLTTTEDAAMLPKDPKNELLVRANLNPIDNQLSNLDPDEKLVNAFFQALNVKPGSRILNVGDFSDSAWGKVAIENGFHYIGFDMSPKGSRVDRSNIIYEKHAAGHPGSAKNIEEEFSSRSLASKVIPNRSQDIVLIMTGGLSDPTPESDPFQILEEALRVLKANGRIVVGSIASAHEDGKAKAVFEEFAKKTHLTDKARVTITPFAKRAGMSIRAFFIIDVQFKSVFTNAPLRQERPALDMAMTADKNPLWAEGAELVNDMVAAYEETLSQYIGINHFFGGQIQEIILKWDLAALDNTIDQHSHDQLTAAIHAVRYFARKFSNPENKEDLERWARGTLENYYQSGSNEHFMRSSIQGALFILRAISKETFSELNIDAERLFNDLIKNGFIDHYGVITQNFLDLRNISDFTLDPQYDGQKEQIYTLIQKTFQTGGLTQDFFEHALRLQVALDDKLSSLQSLADTVFLQEKTREILAGPLMKNLRTRRPDFFNSHIVPFLQPDGPLKQEVFLAVLKHLKGKSAQEILNDTDAILALPIDDRGIHGHDMKSTRELFLHPTQGHSDIFDSIIGAIFLYKSDAGIHMMSEKYGEEKTFKQVGHLYLIFLALEALNRNDTPLFINTDADPSSDYFKYLVSDEVVSRNFAGWNTLRDFLAFTDMLLAMLLDLDPAAERNQITMEKVQAAFVNPEKQMARKSILNYVHLVDALETNSDEWKKTLNDKSLRWQEPMVSYFKNLKLLRRIEKMARAIELAENISNSFHEHVSTSLLKTPTSYGFNHLLVDSVQVIFPSVRKNGTISPEAYVQFETAASTLPQYLEWFSSFSNENLAFLKQSASKFEERFKRLTPDQQEGFRNLSESFEFTTKGYFTQEIADAIAQFKTVYDANILELERLMAELVIPLDAAQQIDPDKQKDWQRGQQLIAEIHSAYPEMVNNYLDNLNNNSTGLNHLFTGSITDLRAFWPIWADKRFTDEDDYKTLLAATNALTRHANKFSDFSKEKDLLEWADQYFDAYLKLTRDESLSAQNTLGLAYFIHDKKFTPELARRIALFKELLDKNLPELEAIIKRLHDAAQDSAQSTEDQWKKGAVLIDNIRNAYLGSLEKFFLKQHLFDKDSSGLKRLFSDRISVLSHSWAVLKYSEPFNENDRTSVLSNLSASLIALQQYCHAFSDYHNKTKLHDWALQFRQSLTQLSEEQRIGFELINHAALFILNGNFTEEFSKSVAILNGALSQNVPELNSIINDLGAPQDAAQIPIIDLVGSASSAKVSGYAMPMPLSFLHFPVYDLKKKIDLTTQTPQVLLIGASVQEVDFFLKRYPTGMITVVNLSPEHLNSIQRSLASSPDAARLSLFRADASKLNTYLNAAGNPIFPDGSFDLVYAEGIDPSVFISREGAAQSETILEDIANEEFRVLRANGVLYHLNALESLRTTYTTLTQQGLQSIVIDGLNMASPFFRKTASVNDADIKIAKWERGAQVVHNIYHAYSETFIRYSATAGKNFSGIQHLFSEQLLVLNKWELDYLKSRRQHSYQLDKQTYNELLRAKLAIHQHLIWLLDFSENGQHNERLKYFLSHYEALKPEQQEGLKFIKAVVSFVHDGHLTDEFLQEVATFKKIFEENDRELGQLMDDLYGHPEGSLTLEVPKKDNAQNGGIDLNLIDQTLETKNAGEGLKFNIDPDLIEQMQNATGLDPVIIEIVPLNSLPQFLGISN